MDVKLICLGEKHAGTEIAVRGPEFIIGRAEECHLRPNSRQISRRHTAITIADGTVKVRDLGSSNGTFVNDEKIEGERQLRSGDKLAVGPLQFEVQLDIKVGGRKRPKVQSVEEAAARSAGAGPVSDEELDLGAWFDEQPAAPSRFAARDTQQAAAGDAAAEDTTVMKQYRHDDAQGGHPDEPSKRPKAPPPPGDSKSAAADTLRRLMGGR